MRDRHIDDETADWRVRARAWLMPILWARVAAIGLVIGGAALMAAATVSGPSMQPGSVALAGLPTLLPLPITGDCQDLSLTVIVTTLTVEELSCSTTLTGEPASSDQQTPTPPPPSSAAAMSSGLSSNAGGRAPTVATAGSTRASRATSSSASKTAAGVLGADTGTPSTGTDIAFGIGIGLVIAGAGIGTGTAEFFKRRRSTP